MRKAFLSLMLVLMVLSWAGPAVSDIVNLGDNSYYWPGYEAINDTYGPDNAKDTIGEPQLLGGQAVIGTGGLTSIGILGQGYSTFSLVKPGDLFIDVGADQTWDYVVSLQQNSSAGNYPIFQVNIPLDNKAAYLMTGVDNSGYWSGYDIRNDHPYALANPPDPSSKWGTASFTGYVENGYTTFAFNDNPILGNTFIVGWTVNCANDVIYEQVSSVPEPSTMLLLGSGLLGLVGFRRKLKK